MRPYELIFIVHPDMDDNAVKELIEQVKSWITDSDGTVSDVDFWGKRKLAYPIRKQSEGQYVLIHADMNPTVTVQIERNFRLTEPIMRYLITSVD